MMLIQKKGGGNVPSLGFDDLKQKADAFGVGVRAGLITPQSEDEKNFRDSAGFVDMSKEVVDAWKEDGNVRRPITLQSGSAFEAAQDEITDDADSNADEKSDEKENHEEKE